MSASAERLDHPAFAPATGRAVDATACTDRAKLAALLQGAAALSLCEAAGWSLARGWESAAVDADGALSGLVARPERAGRPAQEQLRELLLRLFRAKTRIAGRGAGRGAARELLAAWEVALAPMSADEAIGRIFTAADFLWLPEFAAARRALGGNWIRQGAAVAWLAGPPEVRQRLGGSGAAAAPPAPGIATLRQRRRASPRAASSRPASSSPAVRTSRRSRFAAPAVSCSATSRRRATSCTSSPPGP